MQLRSRNRKRRGGRFFQGPRRSREFRNGVARTTFANRYDANFAAKKFFAQREIVPNRFDSPRAVLLIKSVL